MSFQEVADQSAAYALRIMELEKQRDELVAALQSLLADINITKGYRAGFTEKDPWVEYDSIIRARAVLAKAQG